MGGYVTGRVIRTATPDELGEIKQDDGGYIIPYGVDDINEAGMKMWRKKRIELDDRISFKLSKDGFAVDIQPSGVRGLRRVIGKSI